jgi:hypothetical protein
VFANHHTSEEHQMTDTTTASHVVMRHPVFSGVTEPVLQKDVEEYQESGWVLAGDAASAEPAVRTDLGFQVSAAGELTEPITDPAQLDPNGPFDPTAHNVDEVLQYLDGKSDAERDRVLEAERVGKARGSILNAR